MQSRVSSREFSEWLAFYQLEPFGELAAWNRTGVMASLTANLHTDPKGKRYAPEDFMPKDQEQEQSMEELLAKVQRINAMLGGKDERKG